MLPIPHYNAEKFGEIREVVVVIDRDERFTIFKLPLFHYLSIFTDIDEARRKLIECGICEHT